MATVFVRDFRDAKHAPAIRDQHQSMCLRVIQIKDIMLYIEG